MGENVAQQAPALDVLIVDDERNIRTTLRVCLEGLGCQVVEADSAEAARKAVEWRRFDLVFLDLKLGDGSGMELIPILHAHCPLADVVMVTAFGTVANAVEAIRRGARDFLPKPFAPPQIREIVERSASRRALELEVHDLRSRLDAAAPEIDLATRAPAMQQLLDTLHPAAEHDVSILFRGENGTGKSVLARHLHALSRRSRRPFVVVNCPTLSEELLASELFGHVRGAFTGAVKDQPGRVEAAEGGTLFLDEIGELPPALQAKLLRFLQDRNFERVGEPQTRTADVRILAATNRDLDAEVKAGRFREDLLFRLNTFELTVPPLRQRREDILPLARRFLAFFAHAAAARRPVPELTREAEATILTYDWPGNVRELRNAIERASILARGSSIGPEAFPERLGRPGVAAPSECVVGGDVTLEELEREHVRRVLARASTMEEAARILGIDTSTLWRKRKRYEEEEDREDP
jgi:NtrC-family two-component system response regulator AlgB